MPPLKHILLASFFIASAAFATNPLELDHGDQPNHLIPVTPRGGAYEKLLQEKLLITPSNFGRMLFCPSFEGELSVSVYGDSYLEEYPPPEPPKFHITLMVAKTSIYFSMPDNNDEKIQKPIEVTRTDATIDREFAVAIQRAWAIMLLKTRYPSEAYMGCDGYRAVFSVFVRNAGYLYGEIWSPHRGLPKDFVDLGLALADFCTTQHESRPSKQKQIMKQLASFTRKANNAETSHSDKVR